VGQHFPEDSLALLTCGGLDHALARNAFEECRGRLNGVLLLDTSICLGFTASPTLFQMKLFGQVYGSLRQALPAEDECCLPKALGICGLARVCYPGRWDTGSRIGNTCMCSAATPCYEY
jgi:hypothetical protein